MRTIADITSIAFSIFRKKDQQRQLTEELSKHRYQDQKSDYRNARYDSNPHRKKTMGSIVIDGREVANTLQCCHCGANWVIRPGSGEIRGHCLKCQAPTCGHLNCDASGPRGCIPWLKQMEIIEEREAKRIIL